MITERDLEQAIAECQGERDPNANTCVKLAAFYTIRRELFGRQDLPAYSYAPAPNVESAPLTVDYESDTDFSAVLQRMDPADVWPVMDELMTALQALFPRLYEATMRRLRALL